MKLKIKYYTVVFEDCSTWNGKLYKSLKSLIKALNEDEYFSEHFNICDSLYIYNRKNKLVGQIVDLEME